MKKVNVLWLCIGVVFLAVFNLLFFFVGGVEHPDSVWTSYGFIHFAYIMLLLTPVFVRQGTSASVFQFSISAVSVWYFFVEFAAGLVFIIVALDDFNAALIVQAVLAGVYIVMLIVNIIASEKTAEEEMKHQEELQFSKTAFQKLGVIMDRLSDNGQSKKVERVYDAVKASPVKTRPDVAELEYNILAELGALENQALDAGESQMNVSADNLLHMITERNRLLKIIK